MPGLFNRLSTVSRKRKLALFNALFCPGEKTTILDIGAQVAVEGRSDVQLIDSHPWRKNITAVNISDEHISGIKKRYPEVNAVVADACRLPWPDKSFDIAFSNAVIEHVGDFAQQAMMASEIMRVSRRWFITTPNRCFPFEFHLRLPMATWLPGRTYRQAARLVRFNHIDRRYRWFTGQACSLHLLSAAGLTKLFPGSAIIKQRVTFWPETLIVVGGEPPFDQDAIRRAVNQTCSIQS